MEEKEEKKVKKLSYEELENIANQCSMQANNLLARLEEANMFNIFKRLDFLFKVMENNEHFSIAFYSKCAKEIESLLTIKEEENLEEETKK